jgi:phosphoribosylanthranilate isomerase
MKVIKVHNGIVPDASVWPDPIMLDSWSPDQRGGTGRTWRWDAARKLIKRRQVFVAGGLEPGNVGTVVSDFRPYGVDVSSGVESRLRVKDPEKIRLFIRAVRLAEQSL